MKKIVNPLAACAAVLLLLSGCQKSDTPNLTLNQEAAASKSAVALKITGNMTPGEWLIKFKNGTSNAKQQEILNKMGGKLKEKIQTEAMSLDGQNGLYLLNLPSSTGDAVNKALASPEIEIAEPNTMYEKLEIANDFYYVNKNTWGVESAATGNAFGMGAADAWKAGKTGSATVYIGIIDQGYMYTHEDLAPNVGKNPREVAGNGIDDDRNGYVDDVYGWDFFSGDNTVFDGTDDRHGTHVAGIIGAKGGNGIGLAGVNWNVRLLSAKFLGPFGGPLSSAIKAVDYFTSLKKKGLNIVAINNSWGGRVYSDLLYAAIERANKAGIVFVAAAGNSAADNEVSPMYPASYNNSNIISVASLSSDGSLSAFSNYGITTVDIAAPGDGILSTFPVLSADGSTILPGYAYSGGTSMAAPFVTGAVALYASIRKGANVATIKKAILSSAIPTPSLVGKVATGGRLSVSKF